VYVRAASASASGKRGNTRAAIMYLASCAYIACCFIITPPLSPLDHYSPLTPHHPSPPLTTPHHPSPLDHHSLLQATDDPDIVEEAISLGREAGITILTQRMDRTKYSSGVPCTPLLHSSPALLSSSPALLHSSPALLHSCTPALLHPCTPSHSCGFVRYPH
jgi:hypothetical protein